MAVGFVRLEPDDWERARNLLTHREGAERAMENAQVGDRTALVKYRQITGELERIAYAAWSAGAPIDGTPSEFSIQLEWPFAQGRTPAPAFDGAASPPREAWRAADPRASRTAATYERFLTQLERWSCHVEGPEPPPLRPSGIQNRALTEAFRQFAAGEPGRRPQTVPVTYIDGSSARRFPLHSVELFSTVPDEGRVLRFTLLSVRHFSMDATIDGAWLRNREISLPRPRADTDEIVYVATRDQLERLGDEPLILHLFQTGLEAAVTGFYRALVDHLMDNRVSVCVVPHYFAGVVRGKDRFHEGTPWANFKS